MSQNHISQLSWLLDSLHQSDIRRVMAFGWLVTFVLMGLYCASYQVLFQQMVPDTRVIILHIARDWLATALLTPILFSTMSRQWPNPPDLQRDWRKLLFLLLLFCIPSIAVRLIVDVTTFSYSSQALFFYVPRVLFAYLVIAVIWYVSVSREPAAATPPDTRNQMEAPPEPAPQYTDSFVTSSGRDLVTVNTSEIHWISASGNYAELHNAKRAYLLRQTMKRLEIQLDPDKFIRIHRSYIVHKSYIHSVRHKPSGSAQLQLSSGEVLPVSKQYKSRLPHFT